MRVVLLQTFEVKLKTPVLDVLTNIEGNSVRHDTIVEELAQRSVERPSYN